MEPRGFAATNGIKANDRICEINGFRLPCSLGFERTVEVFEKRLSGMGIEHKFPTIMAPKNADCVPIASMRLCMKSISLCRISTILVTASCRNARVSAEIISPLKALEVRFAFAALCRGLA